MAFVLTTDVEEFGAQAGPFLEAHVACNVLATVLLSVRGGRLPYGEPVFAYQLDARGSVVAAALRTPPYPVLVSEIEPDAIAPLLAAWLALDPAPPGVNGPSTTARAVADAWAERTGGETRPGRAMAMHSLQAVTDPPRPAAGRLREGTPAERALLIDWWRAFITEAGGVGGDHIAADVDARLANRSIHVWDDGGPVSMLATQPPVAGVVRIGPVYTPPERRRRGYAGMAVAAASRDALARRARTCLLFTDLANPTSNKIYAEVGYRRFADWEEFAFEPPAGSA